MNIKQFYRCATKEAVVELYKAFNGVDLFQRYPELVTKISIVITGSVPSGHFDAYSDIDVEWFFASERDRVQIKEWLKEYKSTMRERKFPIQLHPAQTFAEVKKQRLTDWQHDDVLRDYRSALIVHDPGHRFQTLQEHISWYPKEVLSEKLLWLFAESVFVFEDRLRIAVKRKNAFYVHVSRVQLLKLLGNTLLLLNGHYPVFEKHLLVALRDVGQQDAARQMDKILKKTKLEEIERELALFLRVVERRLKKDGWITKKPKDYWISLRPKYQVVI